MVSCACHDLDHRGTTSSFQTQSGTVLANLYSSEGSVMEVKKKYFEDFHVFIIANFIKVGKCALLTLLGMCHRSAVGTV